MEPNPYAPTKAALREVPWDEASDALELASRWRRLANSLLDTVGYIVVGTAVGVVVTMVNVTFSVNILGPIAPLFGIAVLLLYYIVGEALFGRTLGKLLTGTRVVAESGGRPKLWQVILRTLYRFVPFDPFSFLGRRRPGWHDRWSKTRVVIARRG